MPGATPSYPPEFKREAVRLVRSSPNRSIAQIARDLGVSDKTLCVTGLSRQRSIRESAKD
jgi:transposase-like protein